MATKWISPTWRMPTDTQSPAGSGNNQSKFDNYSLDFDGNAEYIDIPNGVTTPSIYTVSAWINSNDITSSAFGYLVSTSDNKGIALYEDGSGNAGKFYYWNGSSATVISTTAITINNWFNVVFIINETANEIKFYLNGSLDKTTTVTSISGNINRIGEFTGHYINAKLNQVSIFDYALSEAQVKYLYNNNAGGSTPNPQNPMAIPGNSPIAYYDLGGSSTGGAGASPNTLTVPNSSVPSATVFNFDDDKITTTSLTNLSITNEFSVSFWANVSNVVSFAEIIGASTTNNWADGFGVYVDQSKWQFFVDTYTTKVTSDTTITAGEWVHLAITFSSSGTGKLYVNGTKEGTDITGVTLDGLSSTFEIGTIFAASTFEGMLSNVQIWNKEIIASEVTTLYNNGKPYLGTQPQPANLKGWWRMNIDTSNWDGSNWEIGNSTANYNSALRFNYPSDGSAVDLPITLANTLGNGVTNMSASIWFNLEDNTGEAGIFSLGPRTSAYGKFAVWKGVYTNHLAFCVGGSTKMLLYNLVDNNKPDKTWYHLLVTYDASAGSTRGDTLKIYLNGEDLNIASSAAAVSSIDLGDNQDITQVGRIHIYRDPMRLSNFAVYDTTLTAPDAITLYNGGTPQETIFGSPLSWLTLKDTSTSTGGGLFDNGSVGANGILGTQVSKVNTLVSTLNGTSSGMNTANLVNSDLERSIPYSSYSMDFDGTDKMETKDVPTTAITQVSLSAWVKRDGSQTNYNGVLGVRNGQGGSNNGYLICWDLIFHTNYVQFRVGNGSTYTNIQSNDVIPDNTWTHVLGVLKGTDVFIYINGVKQAATSTLTGNLLTPTIPIQIGYHNSGAYYFNGKISNPAVFDRGLTEDEIATVYNGGVPNDISSLSPINWWSLSGDSYYNGSTWVSPDLGSNSNNAESPNLPGTALTGDGPLSEANGVATGMNIPGNLQGNAPNSTANAFSVNMNFGDKTSDAPVVT